MKRCPYCQAEILETALKCLNCGEWVSEETVKIKGAPRPDPLKKFERLPMEYFSLSLIKFILLYLCTLGLYDFYWFYKNWKAIQTQTQEKMFPFGRALFAFVYCHTFFRIVAISAKRLGFPPTYSPGLLPVVYIACKIAFVYPHPWWVLWFLGFIPLLFIQHTINLNNSKTSLTYQEALSFSWSEIFIVIVGGLLLAALLIGLFSKE
jgi:hypothetical protein